MILFEEKFWGYVFVALAILSIIGIGFAIHRFEDNSRLCKQHGGSLVELPDGYACVKLEKIKVR